MPLNYTSWVVYQGPPGPVREGVVEVHHEFLRVIVENETTVVNYLGLASIKAVRNELPDRDQLILTASDGVAHEFEMDEDQLDGFVESVPRSFHIGW